VSGLSFGGARARTLDFDIEARPLSWLGGDFVTREVTAIAARFIDAPKKDTHVWLLGVDDPVDMLEGFRALYNEADIVTGHYIRGFDLPNLMGALAEYGLAPLEEKWTVDTKGDLVKNQGVSKSQESLAAMLGLKHPKVQMNQAKWRAANRLTPEGIALTKERVVGDINQHIEMLAELRRRGLVGPGRLWTPNAQGSPRGYTP
jgi:hypothetical protein